MTDYPTQREGLVLDRDAVAFAERPAEREGWVSLRLEEYDRLLASDRLARALVDLPVGTQLWRVSNTHWAVTILRKGGWTYSVTIEQALKIGEGE